MLFSVESASPRYFPKESHRVLWPFSDCGGHLLLTMDVLSGIRFLALTLECLTGRVGMLRLSKVRDSQLLESLHRPSMHK